LSETTIQLLLYEKEEGKK